MKRPILLIHRDPNVSTRLAARLDGAGFDVSMADDGATGLNALYQHAPCWVLLDLDLPGMTGFEFLAAIRTIPFPPRVFVVSSWDDPESRERAASLGAEQYFTVEQAMHPSFATAFREALGLPARDPQLLPLVAAA